MVYYDFNVVMTFGWLEIVIGVGNKNLEKVDKCYVLLGENLPMLS